MIGPRSRLRFADLFAGVGGFHAAISHSHLLEGECVYASEIDQACNDVYEVNFGLRPDGDVWPVARSNPGLIPDFDMLCAGFPCQPFSKSGHQRGIEEARGTLFEAILLVLRAKRPRFVLLENVRNLIGPRHRETWATILRLLRDLGYAASSEPTLLSPHELPPSLGSPQVRDRVFIPAIYVGRRLARESAGYLPALATRPLFPEWSPEEWSVVEYLAAEVVSDPKELGLWGIKPDKAKAIDMWEDFVTRLPGRIPRFPIWTDVFLGRLSEGPVHPDWKNTLIAKNRHLFESEGDLIIDWMDRWSVAEAFPSYRKLEWQAQDSDRHLWKHAIQFRPSGVRVRPLTYLPALVAINQTSILGPLARTISPSEAGALQGFSPSFMGGRVFTPHADATVAFRQFGNAVHVGVTRLVAEALVLGAAAHLPVPPTWDHVISLSATVSHRPEAIVSDDALELPDM